MAPLWHVVVVWSRLVCDEKHSRAYGCPVWMVTLLLLNEAPLFGRGLCCAHRAAWLACSVCLCLSVRMTVSTKGLSVVAVSVGVCGWTEV